MNFETKNPLLAMPGPSAAALDLAWSYARGATWKHGARHGVFNIATGGWMFLNYAVNVFKSIDPDPACSPILESKGLIHSSTSIPKWGPMRWNHPKGNIHHGLRFARGEAGSGECASLPCVEGFVQSPRVEVSIFEFCFSCFFAVCVFSKIDEHW